MKIKNGDKIIVITGKNRGKQGEVFKVDSDKDKVWVKGVNIVKKHQKPSQKNKQGGIVEMEAPLHISNVMYHDGKANKRSRIGFKFEKKGVKVRFSKKSGEVITSK